MTCLDPKCGPSSGWPTYRAETCRYNPVILGENIFVSDCKY